MFKNLRLSVSTLGVLLLGSGCATDRPHHKVLATAVLSASSGSVVGGTVKFIRARQGVWVVANFGGLSPGLHGFHIHENGDCSAPDAKSAGGHFNPMAGHHAGPDDPNRHLGDLGNLQADASGNASYSRIFADLTIDGEYSIIGKSIVVHAKADDLKTQPAGDSGDRIACGVIVRQWPVPQP